MLQEYHEILMEVMRAGDIFTFSIRGFVGIEKKISLCTETKQEACVLHTTVEDKFELELKNVAFHPCFSIAIKSQTFMVSERTLSIDGMNNFRDMGGYETYDHSFVKWGLLYRSDQIHNATMEGLRDLKKLGIQTVIDYRSDNEIMKYPNSIIDEGCKTIHLDPDAHTAELAAQFMSTIENEDENLVHKIADQSQKGTLTNRNAIVIKQYCNFVNKEKSKAAFSNMIKLAAQVNAAPLVQHCRGGKDRTGFGCMLLLGLLGVKKEYIFYDYMLTSYNRLERNNVKMKIYKKYTSDEKVLQYLYSLIDTQPEFIEASYHSINIEYGGFENYALHELGITKLEIDNLRMMYLQR